MAGNLPTLAGLAIVWLVITWRYHGRWARQTRRPDLLLPPLNDWQSFKGIAVLSALVAMFLMNRWSREILALGAAGVLLTSRRMASRTMLQLVDWQLLLLFSGLFVTNESMRISGQMQQLIAWLQECGIDLQRPTTLFVSSAVLSNLVSNVPATMLLLPSATHHLAGPTLALSSTLAGNLLVVGSIANMIVIDQAAQLGVVITWRDHARVGIPVTILTLAVAAAWLSLL